MNKLTEIQIARIKRKLSRLETLSSRYSQYRLLVFAVLVLFLIAGSKYLSAALFVPLLLIQAGTFLFLMIKHRQVLDSVSKFKILLEIKQEQLHQTDPGQYGIKETEFHPDIRSHPFAADLHITGHRSLFALLDTTVYTGSREVLASWLLSENPDAACIAARQQLVRELTPLSGFRDRIRVTAAFTKAKETRGDWSMEQLLEMLRIPEKTGFKTPLALLSVLAVSNITLGISALAGLVSAVPFLISFVLYLVAMKMSSDKSAGLFDTMYQIERLLGRFGAILKEVERFRFKKDSQIALFAEIFQKNDNRPSAFLRRINRLAAMASLQNNQLLGPLINLVLPWDLFFSMKLEGLKKDLEPKLTLWLQQFYKLEALNALANFAWLNPEYIFPEIITPEAGGNSRTYFAAEAIGHPLLAKSKKVTNNFKVEKGKDLFLLTGSNMAGKSTFLRTIGINLVLAFAGAPVSAEKMKTGLFRVFTSINIGDSLEDGLSHFYAEVKRLRRLLDALNQPDARPLFYFVDEIYRGTNNRERYAGSKAFLHEVAGKNGIGIISSHDLELGEMEKEIEALSNMHFSELIKDGKMSFDYKIKPGLSPSTNALQIMKLEGLPV